jgi:hypothetical protein
MIIEHFEEMSSSFKGTIIDIESIGNFNRQYKFDSRQYEGITQVILGYINSDHLKIYCADSVDDIEELKQVTQRILPTLTLPLYAFNCQFERCIFFHQMGLDIIIQAELNREKYERKKDVVQALNIQNYGDPFFDDGSYALGRGRASNLIKPLPTIGPAC